MSVETFLLDFDGDLYGKRIRVEFCQRLRDEQKFDSLEALKAQIRENIRQTRDYFAAESTAGEERGLHTCKREGKSCGASLLFGGGGVFSNV